MIDEMYISEGNKCFVTTLPQGRKPGNQTTGSSPASLRRWECSRPPRLKATCNSYGGRYGTVRGRICRWSRGHSCSNAKTRGNIRHRELPGISTALGVSPPDQVPNRTSGILRANEGPGAPRYLYGAGSAALPPRPITARGKDCKQRGATAGDATRLCPGEVCRWSRGHSSSNAYLKETSGKTRHRELAGILTALVETPSRPGSWPHTGEFYGALKTARNVQPPREMLRDLARANLPLVPRT
ncbi:hypothetical protein Bbelb_121430 [Branchiostoma belcheri]|nr:hypothetical protein Bbelb_121430 [Branchiostoma belcheri]